MLGGNPAMDKHPIQGGVEILLVASCYRNRDKLRPDGPHGSNTDFTYLSLLQSHFTAGLFRHDVVKMLAIFAFSHTGYHIYDEVFNSPHECSWRTISLPVRCLSPQLQLLVTTVTLHSPFPLTSGTHSIYVGTIGLLPAWRQVFVFIWRPLCKRSGLLNRVRHFLSVLCLVCIQADLPSGIAHSISLCTLLERGMMLSIHQLTCTRVVDGSGFLSRHNLSTIQ